MSKTGLRPRSASPRSFLTFKSAYKKIILGVKLALNAISYILNISISMVRI